MSKNDNDISSEELSKVDELLSQIDATYKAESAVDLDSDAPSPNSKQVPYLEQRAKAITELRKVLPYEKVESRLIKVHGFELDEIKHLKNSEGETKVYELYAEVAVALSMSNDLPLIDGEDEASIMSDSYEAKVISTQKPKAKKVTSGLKEHKALEEQAMKDIQNSLGVNPSDSSDEIKPPSFDESDDSDDDLNNWD